jgi:hypothetical protein
MPNKYQKKIRGTTVDVYDVLKAFEVTCPATQHAIKKLLMPGDRGHKDILTDLNEAKQSIERAIELVNVGEIKWQVESGMDRINTKKEVMNAIKAPTTKVIELIADGKIIATVDVKNLKFI